MPAFPVPSQLEDVSLTYLLPLLCLIALISDPVFAYSACGNVFYGNYSLLLFFFSSGHFRPWCCRETDAKGVCITKRNQTIPYMHVRNGPSGYMCVWHDFHCLIGFVDDTVTVLNLSCFLVNTRQNPPLDSLFILVPIFPILFCARGVISSLTMYQQRGEV